MLQSVIVMASDKRPISVGIVSLAACAVAAPECGFPVGGSEVQLWLWARKLAALYEKVREGR